MTPESRTANFYNSVGWKDAGGVTEDARRFEDLRPGAAWYVTACRLSTHTETAERYDVFVRA